MASLPPNVEIDLEIEDVENSSSPSIDTVSSSSPRVFKEGDVIITFLEYGKHFAYGIMFRTPPVTLDDIIEQRPPLERGYAAHYVVDGGYIGSDISLSQSITNNIIIVAVKGPVGIADLCPIKITFLSYRQGIPKMESAFAWKPTTLGDILTQCRTRELKPRNIRYSVPALQSRHVVGEDIRSLSITNDIIIVVKDVPAHVSSSSSSSSPRIEIEDVRDEVDREFSNAFGSSSSEIKEEENPTINVTFSYQITRGGRKMLHQEVLTFPNPSILGEIFTAYSKPYQTSYEVYYNKLSEYTYEGKLIGKDIQLNHIVKNSITIVRSWVPRYGAWIGDVIEAYVQGLLYPPCMNYFDDEPINNLPVLGGGAGLLRRDNGQVDHEANNTTQNMIILSYGVESSQRVAYNKHGLMRWVRVCVAAGNMITEPLARRIITFRAYVKIGASSGGFDVIDALEE